MITESESFSWRAELTLRRPLIKGYPSIRRGSRVRSCLRLGHVFGFEEADYSHRRQASPERHRFGREADTIGEQLSPFADTPSSILIGFVWDRRIEHTRG